MGRRQVIDRIYISEFLGGQVDSALQLQGGMGFIPCLGGTPKGKNIGYISERFLDIVERMAWVKIG